MSWRDIDFRDPALGLRGDVTCYLDDSLVPYRLPSWADAQMPDPALQLMATMAAGVRLAFRSDTRRVSVEAQATGFRMVGTRRRLVAFDLVIDGQLHARHFETDGPTLVIGGTPAASFDPGGECEITFEALPAGEKTIELWLPQSAQVVLNHVSIDAGASFAAAPTGPRWIHYGSSISHAMDADGPSETWPALVARAAGAELTCLGFAGQCLLDSLVARTIAETPADRISLKIGVNIVNHDAMRERAFIAAVHGFLDTIRDRQPLVPILIISPIFCGMAETAPGPTIRTLVDGRPHFHHPPRPPELAAGALTLTRIRDLLTGIVERRRDAKLHYRSGLDLFGAADAGHLHDGLHPDADGQRLIAARFTAFHGAGAGFALG